MMTGSSGLICLIFSNIWTPSIPGRRKSSRTRSTGTFSTFSKASSPLLTLTTEWFSERRTFVVAQIMSGSSSTTRILATGARPLCRERDRDDGPFAVPAFQFHLPQVRVDDPLGDRQADAHPAGFGGIKGREHFRKVPRVDPHARVFDLHNRAAPVQAAFQENRAVMVDGLHGIEEHVQHGQKNLVEISLEDEVLGQVGGYFDHF